MAPLSNAERKRRYCAKLSEERHNEIKELDRERKREKKENTIMTEEKKQENRIKERETKRLYRKKKKVLRVKIGQLAFKNRQVKGKAIKKLQRALPKTPPKRVEVIKSLFKSLSPKTKGKVTEHNIVPYNTLSQETLKLVANFYEDDSVSRVMPGKKDVISIKINSTKEKKRKRLLIDDISNVHSMYLEEHPDNPIGKSKFFQLRPLWVIPVNKQSQEVGKCVYHENVDMLCTSLINKARFEKLETDYKMVANADSIWNCL